MIVHIRKTGTIFFFLFFHLLLTQLQSQEPFNTKVIDTSIYTLQVKQSDEVLSDPIIHLNSNQQIEISFDVIDNHSRYFLYDIIYCDADWRESQLTSLEYMDGFNGLPITDYSNSIGTTVSYTNYQLKLPNEDIRFKLSGNYAIRIYDDSSPNKTAIVTCFSVAETLLPVDASITGNTILDTNKTHQQIDFSINTSRFSIDYPQTDLKINIIQNNRYDTIITDFMPSAITSNRIEYNNLQDLIFNAGNEYRRFEFLTDRFNGLHIEDISFHNPYYHVTLQPDISRAQTVHQYDQDQNGKFLINCANCNDPNVEADYYLVHFTLNHPFIPGGDILISGDFFDKNRNLSDNKMEYNKEYECYEKTFLLKQGHYNYQYCYKPQGKESLLTAPVEGDFYQTENKYTIYVYYRPMGERFDRLITVQSVTNR